MTDLIDAVDVVRISDQHREVELIANLHDGARLVLLPDVRLLSLDASDGNRGLIGDQAVDSQDRLTDLGNDELAVETDSSRA